MKGSKRSTRDSEPTTEARSKRGKLVHHEAEPMVIEYLRRFRAAEKTNGGGGQQKTDQQIMLNLRRVASGETKDELECCTRLREFIVSYLGQDASRGLERYPGSLLAIRGTEDYLPDLDRDWIAATPGRNDAVIYIDGADHIFNVLEQPKPDYGPRAIAHSVEWLSARLD